VWLIDSDLAKCALIVFFAVQFAIGQTGTASIRGAVLDGKTQKPVPAAWVVAVRDGISPLTRNTKSGGDGAFQIEGLPAGTYSLCVQVEGDRYLNPCQWGGKPATVTLTSTQAASGISLRLTAASVWTIQLQDPQKLLGQNTKDGRRPDLSIGVAGPQGLYYPAHRSGGSTVAGLSGGIATYTYQLGVPRDMALSLNIASRDLKLGDSKGVALPAAANTQAFQHASGDANPKSFAFTVLGLLP